MGNAYLFCAQSSELFAESIAWYSQRQSKNLADIPPDKHYALLVSMKYMLFKVGFPFVFFILADVKINIKDCRKVKTTAFLFMGILQHSYILPQIIVAICMKVVK